MDWMQALFLLKFTKVECDMIYKKYFFNVEKCALKTNILNKQAKNNTINNNSNTYNYNISNEHINVLYYKNIEKYQKYTKEQKSSYKINKIVERRIIINLSLQWNSKLTKQLNEYF
ncbi:hypothetical protein PFMG_00338 [Plasmodium falciparum IGH-CR14]|uniref:Uncharacterized protein n=1 Tax=Plasmodium falciparum IGH-CR14 TaxID=580059 RepID=A0A0L1I4C1_PLAFA|nr:hypothetical protein PFMG_00338 [Plasmodium falciparum IGH-CR14]